MNILVFDIWGEYAHYKKIYATTSALTYAIPTKTSLYGYIGAILGLEKKGNAYLKTFADKSCLVGISLQKPLVFQRMGINLKAELGRKKEGAPPKPTMMEFVHQPRYRIYVNHQDEKTHQKLGDALRSHSAVYTPTLGLAGLISNFEFVGEYKADATSSPDFVAIDSVIPRREFVGLDNQSLAGGEFYLVEQSLYAIEIDTERNVTERDDIILERKGNSIPARVKNHYVVDGKNICLF